MNPLWFQLYKFVEQWNPIFGDCNRLNVWCCLVGKAHLTFCDIWTIASQASLSIAFSRQESWIGLPFPSPGDLSDPGIEPTSAWQVDYLPLSCLGRPRLFQFSSFIQQIHTEYLFCVGCILDTADKVVTKSNQKTLRSYSHFFFFCNLRVLNEINIVCGIFIVNSAIITEEAKAP